MSQLRRLPTLLLAALFCCASLPLVRAQSPHPQSSYPDDNWVPGAMGALGANASFQTSFTLDRQTLRDLANGFYDDQDGQRIVAGLRSISLHIYHYSEPGMYDPAALNAVRAQYSARGWTHLVAGQNHVDNPEPSRTDLWINVQHATVEGMTVLVENPTTLNLIVINGTLSPLDLLHLRGHFGIPRFPGDRFEPEKP